MKCFKRIYPKIHINIYNTPLLIANMRQYQQEKQNTITYIVLNLSTALLSTLSFISVGATFVICLTDVTNIPIFESKTLLLLFPSTNYYSFTA